MKTVKVIRKGKVRNISVFDLLVGDVLHIEEGDVIPVDGITCKENNLSVDESFITGIEDWTRKKIPHKYTDDEKADPFLLAGSRVIQGIGEMIVCAVGENTQVAKIRNHQQALDADVAYVNQEKTSLQKKLTLLSNDIGILGVLTALITFIFHTVHLIFDQLIDEPDQLLFSIENLNKLMNFLIFSIIIIIVSIPQGLHLAITLALAYSVGSIKRENSLVTNIAACEIMASVNNICIDKTGTLTKNKMEVRRIFMDDTFYESDLKSKSNRASLELLAKGVCINTQAQPKINIDGTFCNISNETECALLKWAYDLGYNFEEHRVQDKIKKLIPYSSERKQSTTLFEVSNSLLRVVSHGPASIMLKKCLFEIKKDKNVRLISKDLILNRNILLNRINIQRKKNIKANVLKTFQAKGLRSILVSYKDIEYNKDSKIEFKEEDLESNLTMIGILGIIDPLRDDIPESVADCTRAGIMIRLITGDDTNMALATAKEAKLLPEDYKQIPGDNRVMAGYEFRKLVGVERDPRGEELKIKNIDNFRKIEKHLRVLSSCSADDKFLFVSGLKMLDNVVAMSGNGLKDVEALKKANVSFAMGITGTDIAKQVADVILLDDNFKSIVTALKWGRAIFDNIRRLVQYKLTTTIVALVVSSVGSVFFREPPIHSIQLLWINLIMEIIAPLAISIESPSSHVLNQNPIHHDEPVLTPSLKRSVVIQTIYQTSVLLILIFFGPELFKIQSSLGNKNWNVEVGVHNTLIFQTFFFMNILHEIDCRKTIDSSYFHVFYRSQISLIMIILRVILQIIFIEYGGFVFKCSPLNIYQQSICLALGLGTLLFGYVSRKMPDSTFGKDIFLEKNRRPLPFTDTLVEGLRANRQRVFSS